MLRNVAIFADGGRIGPYSPAVLVPFQMLRNDRVSGGGGAGREMPECIGMLRFPAVPGNETPPPSGDGAGGSSGSRGGPCRAAGKAESCAPACPVIQRRAENRNKRGARDTEEP